MLRWERTQGFASFTHVSRLFDCRGYHILGIIRRRGEHVMSCANLLATRCVSRLRRFFGATPNRLFR
jgi:hypothetical protein